MYIEVMKIKYLHQITIFHYSIITILQNGEMMKYTEKQAPQTYTQNKW